MAAARTARPRGADARQGAPQPASAMQRKRGRGGGGGDSGGAGGGGSGGGAGDGPRTAATGGAHGDADEDIGWSGIGGGAGSGAGAGTGGGGGGGGGVAAGSSGVGGGSGDAGGVSGEGGGGGNNGDPAATPTAPKRRRGRPKSIVFDYFRREVDDDGKLVNRCIFCNFKSKDKSQNPTYLARHCLTSCRAPPEVIERLQEARSAASHGSRNLASSSQVLPASQHGPATATVGDAAGSRTQTQHHQYMYGSVPGESSSRAFADSRSQSLPVFAPAVAVPPMPDLPLQHGRQPARQSFAPSTRMQGLLPIPAPSVLLSDPFSIPTTVRDDPSRPPVLAPRSAPVPSTKETTAMRSAAGPSATGHYHAGPSPPFFQGAPSGAAGQDPELQSSLRQSQSPQIPPGEPFEGTTSAPATTRETDHHTYPAYTMPRSHASQQQHQQQQLPHAQKSVDIPRLASIPLPVDVRTDRLRTAASDAGLVGPAHFSAQYGRPYDERSAMTRIPASEAERQRLVQRCTASVDLALSNADACTMICLGPLRRRPFDSWSEGKVTAMSEDDEFEALGLGAGSYAGVCTAMAIDTTNKIVFLGAEDCFFHAQVASFVSTCTGRHLTGGSFSAILSACDPKDVSVSAFADVQLRFQNVFLVLDVAHAADGLCLRMATESASVAKCTRQVVAIARFMSTNDLLTDFKNFSHVNQLLESERFSVIVQAFFEIVAQKDTILTALLSLQPSLDLSNTYSTARSAFATAVSNLLSSETFIRSLYKAAKFLEPLSRLVALYDADARTPARGLHFVERDCMDASRMLEQVPSVEMQVTNHESLARMASACLVEREDAVAETRIVAGNAALLAAHLDPRNVEGPQKVMDQRRQQRLYQALLVACNGSSLSINETWTQMLQFLHHKETIFSSEALAAAMADSVTPLTWWARFGRAACPDLSKVALKILTIPPSIGKIQQQVATATSQDRRLCGAALRRDSSKRDHVFCVWNERLSKMSDDALLTIGSPLDSPLSMTTTFPSN